MQKEVNFDYLLWKRIKAGETKAFNELYQLYADVLFSFGMIYSKDRELVKDCIHDLFFDLFKYRKNLADNDHIRNYLFKSLKRKIQTPKTGKLTLVYTEVIQDENEQKVATWTNEDFEIQEEKIEKIKKVIAKLSDHQQEVLNLKFQVGLSYQEIAKILDISVESVRTLVYRAVKTIREELNVNSSALILLSVYASTLRKTQI
jgi:RNA polymerase sigma factor (sigma-70 family)